MGLCSAAFQRSADLDDPYTVPFPIPFSGISPCSFMASCAPLNFAERKAPLMVVLTPGSRALATYITVVEIVNTRY